MTYVPLHQKHQQHIWCWNMQRLQLARASRRLYAQYQQARHACRAEPDLAWIGFLLCLAGGLLELGLVLWYWR